MDVNAIFRNLQANLVEFVTGRRFTLPPELKKAKNIRNALSCIQQRWPDTTVGEKDSERPVFIFSAGWRSGSTLLQRLVLSSKEVLIWGEPIGDAALIARLSYSLGLISQKWPPDKFFLEGASLDSLPFEWVANFAPEIRYLYSAHRAFLLEWLKSPVKRRFGLERWGIKEVRLSIDHARYLKWLFPNARFLFIYRNPFEAFRSWKGNKWRSKWPGYYSRSAIAFARHWRFLLSGFLCGADEVDGLLIKFEDLVTNEIKLKKIATHIGVTQIDKDVLRRRINSPKGTILKPEITPFDKFVIFIICRKMMRKLGYK